MTPKTVSPQEQTLQDALDMAIAQRNNAQNESLRLGAQLQAANRKIVELEGAMNADMACEQPVANGTVVEAQAQA